MLVSSAQRHGLHVTMYVQDVLDPLLARHELRVAALATAHPQRRAKFSFFIVWASALTTSLVCQPREIARSMCIS